MNKESNNEIVFSILMPTFNSEKTIKKALQSIRKQDFPQNKIEILVIDGGSTDRTLEIAEKYKTRILHNPEKIPEVAKRIGLREAGGKYIIMQDSDEVLTDSAQYKKRFDFLEKHPEVYCMLTDLFIPGKGCGVSCAYLNLCGDPVGYIVYGITGSNVGRNKQYLVKKTSSGNVYRYQGDDIAPIGDGGTALINVDKAKQLFGENIYTQEFVSTMFMQMVTATQYVGIIPNDAIVHYSTATLRAYLKKQRFKIYMNLNNTSVMGLSSKARHNRRMKWRMLLFVIYSLSVILPVLDSVRLAVKHKRPSLLLHWFYTYYVCAVGVAEVVKKMLNIKSKNVSYGK